MTSSVRAAGMSGHVHLRALVLAKAGAFRRALVAALSDLPSLTVVGAFSASEAVIDRASRNEVDLVFVDPEDVDPAALVRMLAGVARPPAWFAVTGSGASGRWPPARALLLGAAGTIERPATDDHAALRARLRLGLGARLGDAPSPKRLSTLPPKALRTSAQRAPVGLPVPMTGRIVAPARGRREILAIGCSTGGPAAVTKLIRSLPQTFRVPICVVQHMAAQHMGFFVESLSRQVERPVWIARDLLAAEAGGVYVAAGDAHMTVERDGASAAGRLLLRLGSAPPEHNCRPAVDPLFRSVAAVCGPAAMGVVLTGMGSDGALGSLALREAGAPVLAQNAETSVVWGMPGATYHMGAACAVLPLDQLAGEILSWTNHTS